MIQVIRFLPRSLLHSIVARVDFGNVPDPAMKLAKIGIFSLLRRFCSGSQLGAASY